MNQTWPTIYIYSCCNHKGIYIDQQSQVHNIDNFDEITHRFNVDLIVTISNNDECRDHFNPKHIKVVNIKSIKRIDNEYLNQLFQRALFEQIKKEYSFKKLVFFQSINKYLFMTYQQHILKEMGRLIASHKHQSEDIIRLQYEEKLNQLFALSPTHKNHENTLTHMYGYFKKQVTNSDKETYFKYIEQYRNNQSSYQEVLDLLYTFIKTYKEPYLSEQTIFQTYSYRFKDILKELTNRFK